MSKFSNVLRSAILASLVIAAAFLCGLRLLEIQIADGGKYLSMTQNSYTVEQDIEAARLPTAPGRYSTRTSLIAA